MKDSEIAKRTVAVRPVDPAGSGVFAKIDLWKEKEFPTGTRPVRSEVAGKYAFKYAGGDFADDVRGDVPETEGRALIHVGSHFGKHYYQSHDSETIPVDVLEALAERGYASLITNVDGGWSSWDGRPEFSTTYVDYTDAEVLDIAEEIAKRRDE